MHKFSFSVVAIIIAILPICVACNHNPLNLQEVSGAVTLDSQPLNNGTIRFVPMDREATLGSAVIENGKYLIAEAKGISPGKYTVQISSADQTTASSTKPMQIGDAPPPFRERVPENYNIRSRLTINVKPDGENRFDFDLSSRMKK